MRIPISLCSFILTLIVIICPGVPSFGESQTGAHSEEGAPEASLSALKIPCFECHELKRFLDPKVFPHETHRALDIHCTECHVIRAHASASLNGDTCKRCHSLSVMRLSRTSMPATFSHEKHTALHQCKDCHPVPFRMKANAAKISMEAVNKGGACGKCHNGRIAFPTDRCGRCHN